MKSGKLVKKFFNESEAKRAASYQRSMAKKQGLVILKVEIVDAYQLFKQNGWLKKNPFEKIGWPVPGQFMVIVHYNYNVQVVKKSSAVKKQIVKAAKLKDASKRFQAVKLNVAQKSQVAGLFNYTSNIAVPVFRFRFFKAATSGKVKRIPFEPVSYNYLVAA